MLRLDAKTQAVNGQLLPLPCKKEKDCFLKQGKGRIKQNKTYYVA